jgi:phage N-6-adenine-methyltransferase
MLDEEFGFTVDVAAAPDNAKCERFYTEADNGLTKDWTGETCWMNPPYSNIAPWTEKAATGALAGLCTVVGLLPVRTDLLWFHRDVLDAGAEIRFCRGRIRFAGIGARANAPFPSMIVVWRPAEPQTATGAK